MYQINQITADPLQDFNLILLDGSAIQLEIYFRPMQYGWFINSLVYSNAGFTLQGYRLVVSPNMLFQYQNIVPFGLACFTQTGREPSQIEDFSSDAFQLYILTAEEVAAYAQLLSSGG